MADFNVSADPNVNVYVTIYDDTGKVWNNTTKAWVTYSAAALANYAVYMVASTPGSGFYGGTMPVEIEAGTYFLYAWVRAGNTPDENTDDKIGQAKIVYGGGEDEQPIVINNDLISIDYAKDILEIEGSSQDVLIGLYIAAASAIAESYCNRKFRINTYKQLIHLDNRGYARLTHTPVQSITSLTVDPWNNPTTITDLDYTIENEATGLIRFDVNSLPFSVYANTLQINYQAGFLAYPADLQIAVALLVQQLYGQKGTSATVTSERLGDFAETFGSSGKGIGGLDFAVKTLLDKYKDWTIPDYRSVRRFPVYDWTL